MAYKSQAMQKWAGENQPSSVENNSYKSSAMRNYEANMAKKAQQEEEQRQQALLAQQEAEAPRRATLKDLTLGSIGRGYATSKYGNERYDEIMLGTDRQAKQAQKAKEKTEQEKYNFAAQSKAGQAISGASELIGQQIYNFTNRDTLGAVGANVAGAAAVGAAIPLPEEIVTMPTAVARGLKLGTAATMYQISAAQAYDEMIEAGVSEKTAKTVANVIGAGMGALEGIQADELLKSAKILKGVKGEASEKALSNIMKALGKLGVSTAIETGEEVAQETVSMLGQDYAKKKEGLDTYTSEEYKQRLKDTAVQSALSFGVLGGLGAVGGAVANRNNLNTQTNDAENTENDANLSKNVEKNRKLSNDVEDGTDTNVVTTQPEIAPETAVAEDATKLSLQGKTKQNATNTLSKKRYGEEGKKAFKAVKNDPAKTAEFDKFYQEGLLNKQRPTETVLSKNEATAAYMAGMKDGQTNRTAYAQKQYVTNKEAGLDVKSAENVSLGDRIVYNTIGKAFGKKVVVVPTLKNADGTRSNAKIDLANGIIYITRDAQNGGRVALAHEVVHDMRVAAPNEFDSLARLVTDYHKKFSKYDSKFADTAKLYELDKGKIDYYDMMEEMVADFIADNKGAERIVDMLSTDKPLAQKFIDSVKKVVVQLGKLALDKETRKIVNEWEDLVKQLEKAVKATEEKAKKYTVEQTNAEGDVLTIKDKETGDVRHNLWSYNNGGRQVLMNTLEKQKFPEADVKRAADIMGEMATMMENFAEKYANILDWNNTEVLYDQNGRTYYSAMVKNGDYKINIDLSTICKKRIALQNVLNKLVKQNLINDVSLSPENIATINKILKENGYETQCPACFVESKRYNIEKWANDFADKWNGVLAEAGFTPNGSFDFSHGKNSDHMDAAAMLADDLSKADAMLANIGTLKRDENGNILYKKNGRPQMYQANSKQRIVKLLRDNPQLRKTFTAQDLICTEGIKNIKSQYPEIYSLILTNWGVATPKIVQTTVPYNNEVAVYKNIANKSKYIGGVRMFSFSDFTIDQVFDYVQIVADLYAQKAMMHTYTKEITFAKLFGTTGIKINLSFIPAINKALGKENAGLDANGDLIYSEWGVDPDEAKALMSDKRYSANLTPIMIGVGDKHIWKLLDTDDIRYIIPYHKSSLNPVVAKMTDIEFYKDYSDVQTTRHADGTALTKSENGKFDFYKTLEKNKDARATADAYLKWCDDNGYIPKFEQFREHKNYYKLLVDFNLYDAVTGEFVPQKAVTMEFPAEFSDIVGEELAKQKGLNDKLGIKEDQTFKQIVNAIKKPDVRESKMVDKTKEDYYNRRRWAVENNILSNREYKRFLELITGKVTGNEKWLIHDTTSDEHLIEVEDNLVLTDGDFAQPNITAVYYFYDTNNKKKVWEMLKDASNNNKKIRKEMLGYFVQQGYADEYLRDDFGEDFSSTESGRNGKESAGDFDEQSNRAGTDKNGKSTLNTRDSKMSEPDIPEGYKERGFAESTRTKSTQADEVKQDFIDNPDFYKQLANKTTREKAEAILEKGLSFAEAEFPKLLERFDAVAVPLADMMAKEYSKMGEHDKASNVIREAGQRLTKAGQFSQAAAIMLLKHNPMAALAYAQRDIDKLNVDGKKRFGSKWKDFELTDAETEMFKNIKEGDGEAIKKAYETINKRLAKEYPSTFWQKFIEASRISMLLNPRTNVKNVVSNLLLYSVTRGSGILSSKLQKAYSYYKKDYKPNQSGLLKKEIRTQAEKVWEDIKDTLETTNKYNEGIKANGRDIQVFKEGIGTRVIENIAPGTLHKLNTLMGKEDAGLMETMRNATYWFLEVGDNIFVKQNFISRFGSYMQAKGITDINSMSEEDMAAAIEVAYREALRATFKDDTALSKWLANIKHTGNPYIDALMEMIMPFTKTPANIAMRGIDYSPVGIINTINKARKGADASEVIDELSKNLLGSALIAFGAWLFSKGVVTGGEPENEKQAAFLKQQGWLPYAVKAGDRYVTYDWAQPAAIPIIMGVTIMESLEEGRLGVVDAVKNAGVASFNQWIELSPLQSLQEVMGGYGTVGENLLNTAIEMSQRLIPSALGATARTADTTQRLTYSKGNVMQTQKDIAKSKVPGLSKTLPVAYDTWGNAKQRDSSTLSAAINQYINPASAKLRNESAVDLEIDRLYESTGDEAVYPRKADYTIKKDGKTYKLSNKEYSEFQRIMGEASYDNVKALMDNEVYYSLTDAEKSKIIQKIYENAFETAKFTIMEKQGYEKTAEDIKGMQETKVKQAYLEYSPANIAEYYIVHQIIYGADSDKTANGTTIAGSAKKNALNRLVELGFTRSEARRLYDRLKG